LLNEQGLHEYVAHAETRKCSAIWVDSDELRVTAPEGSRPLQTLPITDASKCAAVRALFVSYEDGDACADVIEVLRGPCWGSPPSEEVQRATCELFGMDGGPLPVVEEACYYGELESVRGWIEVSDSCGAPALELVERIEMVRTVLVSLGIVAGVLAVFGGLLWWRRVARRRGRARIEGDFDG
jgi:hypothetical protein